jgi:hypothetical protein
MFRRVLRRDFVSSFAALVVTLLSLPAAGAQRDHLLRWIVPPDPDVAGYKVYVALSSMDYGPGEDIGPQVPNPQGIASYLYGGLESDTDYVVVMTAYDTAGLESVFSNEIDIPALACDPTPCDDGNLCTIDACSGILCTNDPVPQGTTCDDGDPGTVQDACFSGICSGVAAECDSDLDCGDGNPCTIDACSGGLCTNDPMRTGTTCDDGDPGTVRDACFGGICTGVAAGCGSDFECGDGNPCTEDRCVTASCVNGIVADGTLCDDGVACTEGSTCFDGICMGGSLPPIEGFFEIDVDGTRHPILDASGGYLDVDLLGMRVDYDIAVDPKGKITGTGVANHPLFEAPIPFMVKGRQKGRSHNVKIDLKFKLAAGGSGVPVKGSASQTFDIDTQQGTYARSSKLKVTAGEEKLANSETSPGIPLSEFVGELPNGDWMLFLDVVDIDGSRLEASASLLMSSGSEIDFVGKGKLNDKTGESKLSLKALDKGAKLKPARLVIDPEGLAGGEFKYKVLGQSGVATEWTATASATCEE